MKKWLNKLINGEKTVIVAFGDSVTGGYFQSGTGDMHSEKDEAAVYHQVLGEMLRSAVPGCDVEVINAGVGGDSARRALERFEADVLNRDPDLVTVCFGLNDVNGSVESYRESLTSIFKTLTERNIETVFMTPNMLNVKVNDDTVEGLKAYAAKTAGYQNDGRMDEFMEAAKELANELGIPICDCYAKWKAINAAGIDTDLLLANRINHPTREMHKFFAHELFNTLVLQ